jgi:hypothetical protein
MAGRMPRDAQFAVAARGAIGLVKSGEDRLGPGEIVGAGLGEGHGRGAARLQRCADLPFKRRHDPGRRRLLHAHLARRGQETAAATGTKNCIEMNRPFIRKAYLRKLFFRTTAKLRISQIARATPGSWPG